MGSPLRSVLPHIRTLATNHLSDNRANNGHFDCCLTNARFHNIIKFRTGQTVGTVKCAYGMPGSWLSAARNRRYTWNIANGRGTAIFQAERVLMPIGHPGAQSCGKHFAGSCRCVAVRDATARANRKAGRRKYSDAKQGLRLPKNRRRA